MQMPCYINLEQARAVLAERGITLTPRQMKRAADLNHEGKRKLPFFIDPVDSTLKIEKNTLIEIYARCQVLAENSALIKPSNIREMFDRSR